MQKYKSNIATTSGAALRGIQVHVLNEAGIPASLFLDRLGAIPAANPLITGADGTFYFYAANGRYSLRTTVEGASITDSDVVLLMDPEEITVAGPIAEAIQRAEAAAQLAQETLEDSGIPELVSAAQNAVADAGQAVGQAQDAKTQAEASAQAAGVAKEVAEGAVGAAGAALAAAQQAAVKYERAVLEFPDMEAAVAAAGSLPDQQRVDVAAERKRYRVESGALIFAENFLRDDLAADDGAARVGGRRYGSGMRNRTQAEKNTDVLDLRDFNHLDLTGNNDSTAPLLRAFQESSATGQRLHAPKGRVVTTQTVEIPPATFLSGPGFGGQQDFAQRLIIHIAHAGIGFTATGGGARHLSGFVTKRDQPLPVGGSFTPGDFDWDFHLKSTTDTTIEDVMLLNPTRGILAGSDGISGASRHNFNRVFMHPMLQGIEIECSYDVSRMNVVHSWPFWRQDDAIRDWMQNNVVAFRSLRNDNAVFRDLFSIWHKRALSIGHFAGHGALAPAGTTYKLKLIGFDFDIGRQAYYVEPEAEFHTAHLVVPSMQGPDIVGGHPLIEVQGSGSDIVMLNPQFTRVGGNAVLVGGSNNVVRAVEPSVDDYNGTGFGYPAFEAQPGNEIHISGTVKAKDGNGAPVFGGDGVCTGDLWVDYTPTITPATGAFTSTGAVSGRYRRINKTVEVEFRGVINSNGTGDGGVRFSLPFTARAGSVGVARNNANGAMLSATVAGGIVQCATYNNSHPGIDGAVIFGSINFEVL